ncbi:MAG: AmmeMemoRadiSam system protein B [Gammaproteobacteria bacterium]|nr:AmmeMemoRadiSam system protein B [Gammaproteobacteria bacterium]
MSTRTPAVASLFYPGQAAALRQLVEELLAAAPGPTGQVPKVLVVPHAGYVYSGALAARAYGLLSGRRALIRRVVLLGPAHRVWVPGLALPASTGFATPLGEVPIDAELAAAVLALPGVTISDAAHAEEHSLEVQLPLLQTVLDDFTLLPLVVGGATPAQVASLLHQVWGTDETLIVISTDLSHFHELSTARRMDAGTAAAIESFAVDLHGEQACGAAALNGLLQLARQRGMRIERIGLATSADNVGSADRVVGYGAWWLEEAPQASAA